MNCEHCQGVGFKDVVVNGVHYAVKCDHGAASAPAAIADFAGSQAVSDLVLTPLDRAVRGLISVRIGRVNAITIAEILPSLEAGFINADARSVKDSVRRLREFCGMRIAATKRPPYGYFIVETAEEADEFSERIFQEGVKLLRLCRLFKPERDWVQELRGQMKFLSTTRC